MTDDWWNDPPMSPTERLRVYGSPAPNPASILTGPTYDAAVHYARVKALYDAYPYLTEKQCTDATISLFKNILKTTRQPNDDVLFACFTLMQQLLENETIYCPTLPSFDPQSSPNYQNLVLRPLLTEAEQFYTEASHIIADVFNTFTIFFTALFQRLPDSAFATTPSATMMLPLIEIMPDSADAIHKTIGLFMGAAVETPKAPRRFVQLQQTFSANCIVASSGKREITSIEQLVTPAEFAKSHTLTEVAQTYLANTPFLDLFTMGVPFVIPEETRFSGHWIVAAQGRGKTTLLHTLVMEDLKKDACVILIDPKGELIEPISKLKMIQDRLVIIDPSKQLALNPLDVPKRNMRSAVSQLEYIFGALLQGALTPKQSSFFRAVLRSLLIALPNPTLEDFRQIVTNGKSHLREVIPTLPKDLQDFYNIEFSQYDGTRSEIMWRLRIVMENDTVNKILNAAKSEINIGRDMDAGKVIIINNSWALLDPDGSEFVGRFFVAQVWAAATQRSLRPASQKKPCFLYIDEAHAVIRNDEKIAAIIDQCRSQKIALILAHQRLDQIEDKNVMSALSNCAIKYANVEPSDAASMARHLYTQPEKLRLPLGSFAAYVRDLTTEPIVLKVTPVDFSQYETFTASGISADRGADLDSSPPARPPEQVSIPLNDAHTGDHAEPAEKWG